MMVDDGRWSFLKLKGLYNYNYIMLIGQQSEEATNKR